jgi:hypothetical protein
MGGSMSGFDDNFVSSGFNDGMRGTTTKTMIRDTQAAPQSPQPREHFRDAPTQSHLHSAALRRRILGVTLVRTVHDLGSVDSVIGAKKASGCTRSATIVAWRICARTWTGTSTRPRVIVATKTRAGRPTTTGTSLLGPWRQRDEAVQSYTKIEEGIDNAPNPRRNG